jgi:hypothetical protein
MVAVGSLSRDMTVDTHRISVSLRREPWRAQTIPNDKATSGPGSNVPDEPARPPHAGTPPHGSSWAPFGVVVAVESATLREPDPTVPDVVIARRLAGGSRIR